ncbi:MAG TPA: hypothetical protein VE596_14765 [Gaiellaceae bacterium]|jgi:hypothetical protein|nr:hypothetical protein [Gaiellaceae bacterium]
MRLLAAACAGIFAALVLTGSAGAVGAFGVTEDAGKYARDGGASFFAQLHDVGMNENAITIYWDPSLPGGMAEPGLLDRTLPFARAHGIRVVLTVYARRPAQFTTSPTAAAQFASFLERLALAYPEIHDFVVGNEPNQPRFWQPQFNPDGTEAAAGAYEELLARCYDVLKSVDPTIRVIGLGLSERGNDNPRAPSNASTSPVRFVQALGAAYYASGRTRPIMDALAYHPYPASSTDPISKGLPWPNAGVANLDRIKQAVWDAFHGTAQPTFENGLGLVISEIGWQVGVAGPSASAYYGRENVPVTNEATQAAIYGELVRRLSCDPTVTDLLFLHLVDETDLSGFQSGLERADGSRRPSYDAVKQAIAETQGRCLGKPSVWRHVTGVVGGTVTFSGLRATAHADEAATYASAFVRVSPRRRPSRGAIDRALTSGELDAAEGDVSAGGVVTVARPRRPARPGTYVLAVSLRAAMTSDRRSLFLSRPVRVR